MAFKNKPQVDIKQFWEIDNTSQVGTCKLCPESKKSTAQPEYRKLQSGIKRAYPHWTNMRKYSRSSHFKEYKAASEEKPHTSGGMENYIKRIRVQKENSGENEKICVSFEISPNEFKDIVRKICTVDGLSFNTFEKTGIKELVNPIIQQFKKKNNPVSLNPRSVRQIVLEGSKKLEENLRREFKEKLLCLKFDLATRLGRHFVGLNVQYCSENKLVCKTLAVREIRTTATGKKLSKMIQDILQNEFKIELLQVYSITTDNGSNALAASNFISCAVEEEVDQLCMETIDDVDNIDDIIAAEQLLQSSVFDLKTALEGAHLVRCAAHTLALAVEDCLGRKSDETTKSLITSDRNVVCTLRSCNMRKELRKKSLPMAIIDVETRWGSTYDMLKRLMELSGFCKEYESLNEKLMLTASQWKGVEEMIKVLSPIRILTTQLQSSQLTPGQMLGSWNFAVHLMQAFESDLAEKLVERMKAREEALMSPPLSAGVYLDPEYQVLLTDAQRDIAKIELQALHKRMALLASRGSTTIMTNVDHDEPEKADEISEMLTPMQKMLMAKQQEKQRSSCMSGTLGLAQAIKLINSLDNHDYTKIDSIFTFWENHDSKTLSELAKVVIAVPTTQVFVERLFSGVKYILSDLRNGLAEDSLQAIMLQRLNG